MTNKALTNKALTANRTVTNRALIKTRLSVLCAPAGKLELVAADATMQGSSALTLEMLAVSGTL
jgi:hypothetical protein